MIPKIIHQTWKNAELPAPFRSYQQSWRDHHPGWEYRFYDDAACRALVRDHVPTLLPLYDACPHPVQRADIFRYLAVARYGGLYADLDMECYRPMDALLAGASCVFGIEARLAPRRARLLKLRHTERIANCIFATEAGHPVFTGIIAALERIPRGAALAEEVIGTTGPGMLTDVVQAYRQSHPVRILPQICWLPPTRPDYPNRFPFNLHMYAKHHFAGTWKPALAPHDDPGAPGPQSPAPQGPKGAWATLRAACREIPGPVEWLYLLPPSPLWPEDLLLLKKKRKTFTSRRDGA
jgi:inositol phosphorylceramide mannosyltransferase catalytic subunit